MYAFVSKSMTHHSYTCVTGASACEDAQLSITLTAASALKELEAIECDDVEACKGATIQLVNNSPNKLVIKELNCGDVASCAGATFVEQGSGGVVIENCECGDEGGCDGATGLAAICDNIATTTPVTLAPLITPAPVAPADWSDSDSSSSDDEDESTTTAPVTPIQLQRVAANVGTNRGFVQSGYNGQECGQADPYAYSGPCPVAGQVRHTGVQATGEVKCEETYDCCTCTYIYCVACDKFVVGGDSGAWYVTDITIQGDCDDGAVIECSGDSACEGTELTGTCVSDIKCSGDRACLGATWDVKCLASDPCKVECTGDASMCTEQRVFCCFLDGLHCSTKVAPVTSPKRSTASGSATVMGSSARATTRAGSAYSRCRPTRAARSSVKATQRAWTRSFISIMWRASCAVLTTRARARSST